MAGYIFNLDNIESLKLYIDKGVYATKLNPLKNNYWSRQHEGTLADYLTMKSDDSVYFFIDRKIYGIGKLINIHSDCKFSNYPQACFAENFNYVEKKNELLWDEGELSIDQRWLCTFQPSPCFFINGIDMDDVLASNPSAFKMLRTFWRLSFIKFDDEENQAFKDAILRFNQDALHNPKENENIFKSDYRSKHNEIYRKLNKNKNYIINISPILINCADGGYLEHEMALEAGLLHQISYNDEETKDIFGRWDYLSHQVVASPFKPIDYMDKMDAFGYRYIKEFKPTRSKYLVAEIKKDEATINDIEQLLKYVDWVKDEYCYGDYEMINAFLIAYHFNNELINYKKDSVSRKYIINRRPAKSYEWNNLQFVKYSFDGKKKIKFQLI